MIVGANVKAARTALGMTQEDLAKKAGYKSYISIQKIEYGVNHPPVDKIIDLAEALNVSYNYLIGESPDMKRTLMDEIWKNVRQLLRRLAIIWKRPQQILKRSRNRPRRQ